MQNSVNLTAFAFIRFVVSLWATLVTMCHKSVACVYHMIIMMMHAFYVVQTLSIQMLINAEKDKISGRKSVLYSILRCFFVVVHLDIYYLVRCEENFVVPASNRRLDFKFQANFFDAGSLRQFFENFRNQNVWIKNESGISIAAIQLA